jgi:hypothetical protein
MAAILEIKYFNSFWLKKVRDLVTLSDENPVVFNDPALPANLPKYYTYLDGVTVTPVAIDTDDETDWYIEEARIRGGYNNTITDLGVKAYIVEDTPTQQHRANSLIYSGVFNSRTGVNKTNEFSVADTITKSLDPSNGSVQKLFAEDTNLTVFQEAKVSRALIDKSAIYSAEGEGSVTSSTVVIGQIVPYGGNYGISRNPESFATYGYRKYFTDKDRNVVLRLSQDGITEISSNGLTDFFRDQLNATTASSKIIGGLDQHTQNYTVSIQPIDTYNDSNIPTTPYTNIDSTYRTLSFSEDSLGWTSFYTYKPTFILSLRNNFYSIKDGAIWKHYELTANKRSTFYGVTYPSSVTLVLNPSVSEVKTFKTINYEGSPDWTMDSIITDSDVGLSISKATNTSTITTLSTLQNQLFLNNFKKKENKYFGNIINISPKQPGQILWGQSMSGIDGFWATVTMSTIDSTDPITFQGKKELFAVSSNYVNSSY